MVQEYSARLQKEKSEDFKVVLFSSISSVCFISKYPLFTRQDALFFYTYGLHPPLKASGAPPH